MRDVMREIHNAEMGQFNILEEYSKLSPRRKVILCDHLFVEGRQAFYNTVELLWPDSNEENAKTLEAFLHSLRNKSH